VNTPATGEAHWIDATCVTPAPTLKLLDEISEICGLPVKVMAEIVSIPPPLLVICSVPKVTCPGCPLIVMIPPGAGLEL
jgi:hypothetical protein